MEAQAVFDLENAKSALDKTIGLALDVDPSVQCGDQPIVLSSLGDDIKKLMNEAVKNSSDITAQVNSAAAQLTDQQIQSANAK